MKKFFALCLMAFVMCNCTKIEDIENSVEIIDCHLSSPNSVGGCDLSISFRNVSPKTIKYISFGVDFYNAVGDIVPCEIRGYGFYAKVTGPIDNLYSGYTATWDCPIYNWSARSAKIDYIYIEYMDGTTIEIKEKNLYLIGYF